MRVLRFLVGFALLPLCAASLQTVAALLQAVQPTSVALVPAPTWAVAGGFGLWLLLYFTLPAPVRTYVLAHELTHALWGSAMGARVLKMRVSKAGGSVTLTKSNFLITLAPYFFPLYTVLVIVAYYAVSVFYDLRRYDLLWLGLVGFTWSFHFTFTCSTLMERQSDIRECGHLFSYAVILILNALGVALGVVLVSTARLEQLVQFLAERAGRDYLWAGRLAAAGWQRIAGGLQ